MKKRTIKALGLMSGTSADGISMAFTAVDDAARKIKVLCYATYPYNPKLRRKILSAAKTNAAGLSELNFELGSLWAAAVRKFCSRHKISYSSIDVIGSHGQTVCHGPKAGTPNTLQIGEASFIAEETRRPVVCDFRPADMAAGGQGAPLIPFMDEYLFGGGRTVALQNIGGVGNISFVGRGITASGFDTGPGNSLMDTAVSVLSCGKFNFDAGGRWAAAGRIDHAEVSKLLRLPFFYSKPPKSLDREEFAAGFLKKHFKFRLKEKNKYDVLATLNYFTAASVGLAVRNFAPKKVSSLIVSGGGALNPVLMRNLQAVLGDVPVKSISGSGIHPLAKEPACFALLAYKALNARHNSCPSATGARGPRVLGKIILQ